MRTLLAGFSFAFAALFSALAVFVHASGLRVVGAAIAVLALVGVVLTLSTARGRA